MTERHQHQNIPFWTPAGGSSSGTRRNPSGFELAIPGSSIKSTMLAQRLGVFIAPQLRPTEAAKETTTTWTTRPTWLSRLIRNQQTKEKSVLEEVLENMKQLQEQMKKLQNEQQERKAMTPEWTTPLRWRYSPPRRPDAEDSPQCYWPDAEDDLISETWSDIRAATCHNLAAIEADTHQGKKQIEVNRKELRDRWRQLNENDISSSDDEVY